MSSKTLTTDLIQLMDTYRVQHAALLKEKILELVQDKLEDGENASDIVREGLAYYFEKKPIRRVSNHYQQFIKDNASKKIGEGNYFNWDVVL